MTGRGTSNTNVRGSAEARRRRKAYLLKTYAADVDLVTWGEWEDLYRAIFDETNYLSENSEFLWVGPTRPEEPQVAVLCGLGRPAVRCYRCGRLLDYDTMEVDRIKPGCEGGTYARGNIRPACGPCNKKTGNEVRDKRRRK